MINSILTASPNSSRSIPSNTSPFDKYLKSNSTSLHANINLSCIDSFSTPRNNQIIPSEADNSELSAKIKLILTKGIAKYKESYEHNVKAFNSKITSLKKKLQSIKLLIQNKTKIANLSNSFSNQPVSVCDLAESYEMIEEHNINPKKTFHSVAHSLAPSTQNSPKNSFLQQYSKDSFSCLWKDTADIIELKSKCSTLRENVLSLKSELKAVQNKYDDSQKENLKETELLKDKHSYFMKESEVTIATLQKEKQTLEYKLSDKSQDMKQTEGILNLLKEDNSNLNKSLEILRSRSDDNNTRIKFLEEQNNALQAKLKENEDIIKHKEEELSALNYQSNLRSIKITELSQKLCNSSGTFEKPKQPIETEKLKKKYKEKINQQQSVIEALSMSIKSLSKISEDINFYGEALNKFKTAYLKCNPDGSNFLLNPEGIGIMLEEAIEVIRSLIKEENAYMKLPWNSM
jgi:hypothetical protein